MRFHKLLVAAGAALALAGSLTAVRAEDPKKAKCVVSGQEINVTDKTPTITVNGEKQYFCCNNCPKAFAANPEKYIKAAGNCPVNKAGAAKVEAKERVVLNNNLFYFCCGGCPGAFAKEPAKFVKELKDPVSGKAFAVKADSPHASYKGSHFLFASAETKAEFEKDPAKYAWPYSK